MYLLILVIPSQTIQPPFKYQEKYIRIAGADAIKLSKIYFSNEALALWQISFPWNIPSTKSAIPEIPPVFLSKQDSGDCLQNSVSP